MDTIHKTEVVEKRVKSTVIRRRKTLVEEAMPAAEEPLALQTSEAGMPVADAAPGITVKQQAPDHLAMPMPGGIIRTITLPLTPGAAKKEDAAADAKKKLEGGLPAATPFEEEEDDDKKAKKPSKYGKVAKKKLGPEGVVEVDGIGRVSSITQLNRVAHVDRVDRVFEPEKIAKRKKIISKKGLRKTLITVTKESKRVVEMDKALSVTDLAHAMGIKSSQVIRKLMDLGMMATANQALDLDAATLVAHEFGYQVKNVSFDEAQFFGKISQNIEPALEVRPPVVTVMGHVDHGKTSLLDAIRKTNVTAGEFGGITQHIGAYTVSLSKGKITFLDTPGHAAFAAMRARGASVTDVVVLVVAADDGVMLQTLESIDHAKQAKVPIVVAINKIDKPEADVERIKRQLAEALLIPEEWGGQTMYCLVSAIKGEGIDHLLESILLQAEILELKAARNVPARGVVVEARLDRTRGPVATVLMQQGTLKAGDIVVAGLTSGRIRAMTDFYGKEVRQAHPSHAVEVLGLESVPEASDTLNAVPDEATAQTICDYRKEARRQEMATTKAKVTLEDFFKKTSADAVAELKVVVKADVQGSVEAVAEALNQLSTDKVKLSILHKAVGGVNESDVLLASTSDAIIIGFNVRPETKALVIARSEAVDIRLYKIIYEMVDEVKKAMVGLLAPIRKDKYLGRAEVRQTFGIGKKGLVAGCQVIDGKMLRGADLRLLRDNVVVYEGKIASLKRVKDDAKEVAQGYECGVGLEGTTDIKPGDVIEAFQIELIQPEL